MRLEPVERPKGLKIKLAYWGIKKQMGKVMTPVKVLTARMPDSLKMTNSIVKFETHKIRLDQELHYLIVTLTSQLNGCGFCSDLARSMFIRNKIPLGKVNTILDYPNSSLFSKREKAALAYISEITLNRKVSENTFSVLKDNFEDWEIAEITWLNAIENYYNLINIPLEIDSDGFCSIFLSSDVEDPKGSNGGV